MSTNIAGSTVAVDGPLPSQAPQSLRREVLERFRRTPSAMICGVIVVLYVLLALSTFLPNPANFKEGLYDQKISASLAESYEQPRLFEPHSLRLANPAFWFGLDIQGRSVFWRVLYGSRVALLITVQASVFSIGIGMLLGVLAGFFGGWLDDAITWLYTTISAIPWLLLVIAVDYVFEQYRQAAANAATASNIPWDLIGVILALGLTDWVGLCRLMRGEVIKLRERDFVAAARALGMPDWRILFRHILPNTMHIIIITFSLGAVSYVQVEVILSFLGLGISDRPSWGRMIDDAKLELLRGVWWQATAATAMIFILCLALNILGDFLRDALDPKLHGVD